MIGRFLTRLDMLLMLRVFMPIAHWVDYHWHRNHFWLARQCLLFGWVCFTVGCFLAAIHSETWVGLLNPLIAGVMVPIIWRQQAQLQRASDKYERNPMQVPIEAYGYVLMDSGVRAMLAITCGNVGGWTIAAGFLTGLPSLLMQGIWMIVIVVVNYLAGSIPSGRNRKPKKERAPAAAMPVPA